MDNVIVRQASPDDISFILATWLKGYYHGNAFWQDVDRDLYFAKYKEVVLQLLATANVSVACLSDDNDVILGYSVHKGDVLHWMFIKKAWRKIGLAKLLIPHAGIKEVTHLTKIGRALLPKEWKYNPFL